MAITLQLVNAGPDWLRYLCTQDGVISSPPVEADGAVVLPNAGGVTPDFRTDAPRTPLLAVARAAVDGFGPLAVGALTQAQIRAILNSDDNAKAVLTNLLVGRCVLRITPRLGAGIRWCVDAVSDAAPAAGDPTVRVGSTVGVAGTAYMDIMFRHSRAL